jgi:very-short-patch-repair endonuclease
LLRRDATYVERKLWYRLRSAQIDGTSFRRQHPAGHYVLDFYSPTLLLAIELDGGNMESKKVMIASGMSGCAREE